MSTIIKNAILYTCVNNTLEYNATHSATIAQDAVIRGCGITNTNRLALVLGKPDAPQLATGYKLGSRTLKYLVIANLTLNEDGQISAIAVNSINRRPVIGISWKSNILKDDYIGMAQTLERNGAYALYLPRITTDQGAQKVLSRLDGVLFTGGADTNPALYGEKQTPHGTQKCNNTRDRSDLLLMKYAVEMDIPMLAICRSCQNLNVVLGGKLIQDIPYYFGQKVLCGQIDPCRVTKVLSGKVDADSEAVKDTGYILWDNDGQPVGPTYDAETDTYMENCGCSEGHLRVEIDGICHSGGIGYHGDTTISSNSRWLYKINGGEKLDLITTSHHQAVDPDNLGMGLTIVAKSCDGIVEAVEYQSNLFCLGVQYHPEKDALRNHSDVEMDQDKCCEYFRTLIKYALIYSLR